MRLLDKLEHFDGVANKDWKGWYGTWKQTAIEADLPEADWLTFLRPYIMKLPGDYATTVFEQIQKLPQEATPAATVKAKLAYFEHMMVS